jgi:hypothetical protein
MRLLAYGKICIIYIIVLTVGCGDIETSNQHIAEILLWEEWLEKGMNDATSGDGPYYSLPDTILFQNDTDIDPLYSAISSFVIIDTMIIVSDNSALELHAFTIDGEKLWTSGQPGEGPGCLSMMGGIDASADYIAVSNMSLGRVDLFNISDGLYEQSLPIQWPFDVCIYEDSTIVAVSIVEEHLVTLFDCHGSVLDSFGNWEPPSSDGMPYSPPAANINLKCDIYGNYLVVSSVYNNYYQIYDLRSKSLHSSFSREPSLPLESSSSSRFILQVNDCVFNVDGNVVALLCPTRSHWLNDRYSDQTPEEIAYKGLDVFDISGNYIRGFAVKATWDAGAVQFVDTDMYLSSPEVLLRYSELDK